MTKIIEKRVLGKKTMKAERVFKKYVSFPEEKIRSQSHSIISVGVLGLTGKKCFFKRFSYITLYF